MHKTPVMSKFSRIRFLFPTVLFLLLFGGLQSAEGQDTLKYLFMGHTYQWYTVGDKVDERIEKMDLSVYDGIWLGGDVCSEALMLYSTLEYIDSMFNLRNPNTHWALGNHDSRNGNWIWLETLIGRKTYSASHNNGISTLVLNTNLTPFDCEQLDDQWRMIANVCDTIQSSSHLILLMHHGIWDGIPGLPSPFSYAQSNLIHYNFNCYDSKSSFVNEIYPRLVEVKNRGVEVICILGDMGAKKVEYLSDDGIHFMGAGLNRTYFTDPELRAKSPLDWAIVFTHVPKDRKLEWEFAEFGKLSGSEW
jgi:hypothetical protein